MCNIFKITYEVISPFLFNFNAYNLLGIELQQMYVDGCTDNTFDIVSKHYKDYEEFIKARSYQKIHIDLIKKYKEYFEITNDERICEE